MPPGRSRLFRSPARRGGAETIGALVGPLSAGEHTIVVTLGSSTLGGGFGGSLTYRLTVTSKGRG